MTESETQPEDRTIPFYPDHVTTEAKVTLVIVGLVVVAGIAGTVWPVGLDAPADPMVTPEHTTPEWYFLFLYEMLKYIPKTAGVLIPIGGIILIALWPFLDQKEDTRRAVRNRAIVAAIAMLIIFGLTILGMTS